MNMLIYSKLYCVYVATDEDSSQRLGLESHLIWVETQLGLENWNFVLFFWPNKIKELNVIPSHIVICNLMQTDECKLQQQKKKNR